MEVEGFDLSTVPNPGLLLKSAPPEGYEEGPPPQPRM